MVYICTQMIHTCIQGYMDACKHTHTWIHMHYMNTHSYIDTHSTKNETNLAKMRQISSHCHVNGP